MCLFIHNSKFLILLNLLNFIKFIIIFYNYLKLLTMINRNLNCIYLKDITYNKLINEKFI